MLRTAISAGLGAFFIVLGALNVCLIFHASRRLQDRKANARLIRAHRAGGYLFILLFCVMTYFMLLKIKDMPDDLSLRPMLHMTLALLLAPLLFVKVLIARYYKSYHSVLMTLGIGIFAIAFVLVAMTAGPYVLRRATIRNVSMEAVHLGSRKIDLQAAQSLTQKRCGQCHNLDRVFGARKDASGWLATVNRMRALPASGISETDATTILSYLISESAIDSSTAQGNLTVGKALVDAHCNRCHGLDRTYEAMKTPDDWRSTVMRMVGYARGTEGFFKPGEDEQIIRFLSTTQTPEAVERRRARVSAAEAKGESLVVALPARQIAASDSSTRRGLWATFGVIAGLCTGFGTLLFKRPNTSGPGSERLPGEVTAELQPRQSMRGSIANNLVLHLVRIERQAQDCVTLRFRVPPESRLHAKPGQFLTFTWLLDGRKLVRSYSICSSPTQTGYVEITPKRVKNGCVSIFLNERATAGLTVEAKGPFGQFYFDENQHHNIVLIAAGSGITPMLAMLRYIDDRCLPTRITLLYSARTRHDILFKQELMRLQASLRNFRHAVTLTQPDDDWDGPRGRVDRELLRQHVPDPAAPIFLCGPEAFMEGVKAMLASLGVDGSRIKQERFSGKRDSSGPSADGELSSGVAYFARSDRSCGIPAGCTLLEVADRNGIPIPSGCRQGQCGTCTTRLITGEVRMDAEDGLDRELKARGYILPCVARAQGDVSLEA